MSGAATDSSLFDAAPDERVSFRTRLLVYLGVWLLAALVDFLVPDHELTFAEQVKSAPFVPLVAAVGLSLAATFPDQPTTLIVVVAAAMLIAHGIATLIQTQRSIFRILIAAQFVLLFTAATYLIRFSALPSGP